MTDLFQALGNGILIGLVYALLGLCIVIIYKASEAFNFAVGEFLVVGSFLFYFMFAALKLPLPVAFPLGLIAAGVFGAVVERLTIKPLMTRPPITMTLMTLGLIIFLRASLGLFLSFGGSPGWRPLRLPDISWPGASLIFISDHIWAGILALGTFALVIIFLFRTHWGLAVRATSEDPARAIAYGIDSRFVLLISWAISAACIALAGVMISNFGILSPSSALVGFRAIPVVLIGGLDSIGGALVGGIIVGVVESLVSAYIEPLGPIGFKEVAAYILLLMALFIRPHGLFGTVRIERV